MEMTNVRGQDYGNRITKEKAKIADMLVKAALKFKEDCLDIGVALKSVEIKQKEGD